ncbi:MAG TPA: CARDB domain-containing protein [Phycisphaerales bacterium]|nr:CARDB domain-containing protein [Phycisphaerales bacterium]
MSTRWFLAALPIAAGALVGCEVSGRPGGAVVPIGGGTAGDASPRGARADNTNRDRSNAEAGVRNERERANRERTERADRDRGDRNRDRAATGSSVAYYPTGNRASSALMIEKIAPAEAAANQAIEYTIRATNISGGPLDNVTINESLPQGFNVQNVSPQGNNGQFNLGTLAPGESKAITVRGSFARPGNYGSCATASYSVPVCMDIAVVAPSLAITKTAPAEALICDNWPVQIVVTNNGTGTARNVVVRDPLAADLVPASGRAEWNIPSLAGGESRTITFNVKANKVGSFNNTATAMADGGLQAQSNATTTVVRAPMLAIDVACPERLRTGQSANYRIKVTNTGNAPAANTVVRNAIPAGATFRQASNGGAAQGNAVVWNLGTIAPGASAEVMLQLSSSTGTITNEAVATATCAPEVRDGCVTSFQGVPDIGTAVVDGDGVVEVGANHTYTVEVRNQGGVNLTNTRMIVTMPEGMAFVSSAQATAAGNKVTFNFGTLAPNQTKTGTFVVKSSRAGELVVVGETTCNELQTPVTDEELTNFVD